MISYTAFALSLFFSHLSFLWFGVSEGLCVVSKGFPGYLHIILQRPTYRGSLNMKFMKRVWVISGYFASLGEQNTEITQRV